MKRVTAVVAAMATVGMAAPSWAEWVDETKTVEILYNGEVHASFPPKKPNSDLYIISEVNLLIRYQGKIYHCMHMLSNNGNLVQQCFE